jgi:hypothetical protein
MNEMAERLDVLLAADAAHDGPALPLRVQGPGAVWTGARGRRAVPDGPPAAAEMPSGSPA